MAKLASRHPQKRDLRMIGIDTVEDMVHFARRLSADDPRLSFITANALDFEFERADMFVANYTIQFLPPRVRQNLIDAVYKSLNWGAPFLCSKRCERPMAVSRTL